jgi:hypothetical protein
MNEPFDPEPAGLGERGAPRDTAPPHSGKLRPRLDGRVIALRRQLEEHTYRVDAAHVAESIIDAALELRPASAAEH